MIIRPSLPGKSARSLDMSGVTFASCAMSGLDIAHSRIKVVFKIVFTAMTPSLHSPKQQLMQNGLMYQQGPGRGVSCDRKSVNVRRNYLRKCSFSSFGCWLEASSD